MKKAFGFHFNSKRNDADSGWKILQKTDKWYGLEPCICRQVDGFSDHCKQYIKASLVYGIGTVEVKKQVYG